MTSFYLPRKLSDFVDAQGGPDWLRALVEREMLGGIADAQAEVLAVESALDCPYCGGRTLAGRCTACGRLA